MKIIPTVHKLFLSKQLICIPWTQWSEETPWVHMKVKKLSEYSDN